MSNRSNWNWPRSARPNNSAFSHASSNAAFNRSGAIAAPVHFGDVAPQQAASTTPWTPPPGGGYYGSSGLAPMGGGGGSGMPALNSRSSGAISTDGMPAGGGGGGGGGGDGFGYGGVSSQPIPGWNNSAMYGGMSSFDLGGPVGDDEDDNDEDDQPQNTSLAGDVIPMQPGFNAKGAAGQFKNWGRDKTKPDDSTNVTPLKKTADAGGAIAENNDDLGSNAGVQDSTGDHISQALQVVNDALMYGRKKYGLLGDQEENPPALGDSAPDEGEGGEEAPSYEDGGEVDNEEDTYSPPDSTQETLDAHGAIPDEPQTADDSSQGARSGSLAAQPWSVGGAAKGIMAYLHGADAATPDAVEQLKQQVDPNNQYNDGTKNLLAVAAAGNENAQFGVLQSYRRSYDAAMAHARAALTGAGGRAPDLGVAADSATKAFTFMPDGITPKFDASDDGITATVTTPGRPAEHYQFSPQQFAGLVDTAKAAQFDHVYEGGTAALFKQAAGTGQGQQQRAVAAPQPAIQHQTMGDYVHNFGGNTPQGAAAPGKPNMRDARNDDSTKMRAFRAYPMASQGQKRALYQDQLDQNEAGLQNKLDVEKQKGANAERVWGVRGQTAENVAGTRAQAYIKSADLRSQPGRMKALQDMRKLEQTSQDANERNQAGIVRAAIMANKSPDEIEAQLNAFGKRHQAPPPSAAPAQGGQTQGAAGGKVKMRLPDGRVVYVQG